jgi:hypothetical protein
MRELWNRIRRFFRRQGDPTSYGRYEDSRIDSMTATDDTAGPSHSIPPGYVKSYDEGRPRK